MIIPIIPTNPSNLASFFFLSFFFFFFFFHYSLGFFLDLYCRGIGRLFLCF